MVASIFLVWWLQFENALAEQTYKLFGLVTFFLIIALIISERLKVKNASKYFFLIFLSYFLANIFMEIGIGHRLCLFGSPCYTKYSMGLFMISISLVIALGYCAIVGRINDRLQ
jgi:hypothetical protein